MAEVVIVDSRESAGTLVAEAVLRLCAVQSEPVLGLATGDTPLPVYRALAERRDEVDFTRFHGFALDEYVGIDPEHPLSYRRTIHDQVTVPLGLDPERVHVPNGDPEGLPTAGAAYEAAIQAAGGVDLQILGIGSDGHIAFNEPGSSLASRTRVKTLTERTRADNARFFDSIDEVPTHCITQGVGTILEARHLVLLAFGEGKADAIAAAVEGPLTAMVPASAIQLHPHVTVVIDEAAASKLTRADYYRAVWAAKPEWQHI